MSVSSPDDDDGLLMAQMRRLDPHATTAAFDARADLSRTRWMVG
jgi:hypothetical protein